MSKTKIYLGARIQELRKQAGLKQSELAEVLDVDPKYISKIECGRCFPSFDLLDRIAETLHRPIVEFLDTEHLQARNIIQNKIIEKIKKLSDEKFRMVYRILNEIL